MCESMSTLYEHSLYIYTCISTILYMYLYKHSVYIYTPLCMYTDMYMSTLY